MRLSARRTALDHDNRCVREASLLAAPRAGLNQDECAITGLALPPLNHNLISQAFRGVTPRPSLLPTIFTESGSTLRGCQARRHDDIYCREVARVMDVTRTVE